MAGRANLGITSPAHEQLIDRGEAGGQTDPAIRLVFEVDDAPTATDRLQDAG